MLVDHVHAVTPLTMTSGPSCPARAAGCRGAGGGRCRCAPQRKSRDHRKAHRPSDLDREGALRSLAGPRSPRAQGKPGARGLASKCQGLRLGFVQPRRVPAFGATAPRWWRRRWAALGVALAPVPLGSPGSITAASPTGGRLSPVGEGALRRQGARRPCAVGVDGEAQHVVDDGVRAGPGVQRDAAAQTPPGSRRPPPAQPLFSRTAAAPVRFGAWGRPVRR